MGNTSWKCWKWHLQDSRFQNFLQGGGWLLFFISHPLQNLYRIDKESQFLEMSNIKFILLRGTGALPLYPAGGVSRPQTPCLYGGQRPHSIAIYFQNITLYFKSYWQCWLHLSFFFVLTASSISQTVTNCCIMSNRWTATFWSSNVVWRRYFASTEEWTWRTSDSTAKPLSHFQRFVKLSLKIIVHCINYFMSLPISD